MIHVIQTTSGLLVDCAVKGALVLAPASILTLLMRRAPAAARHLVWGTCAIGLLTLPALALLLPGWHVLPAWTAPQVAAAGNVNAARVEPQARLAPVSESQLTGRPIREDRTSRASTTEMNRSGGIALPRTTDRPEIESPKFAPRATPSRHPRASPPLTVTSTAAGRSWPISEWIVAVWSAGAAACLVPLVTSAVVLLLLSRRSTPAASPIWQAVMAQSMRAVGLRRRPMLLQSRDAQMPMTWGLICAKVLLPAGAEQWSAERQRIVLLHELAHVKRHDWAWLLAAKLAWVAYWYNPLAWHAVRRLSAEAERACDDRVLRTGQPAPDYAQELLQIVSSLRVQSWTSPAAVGMARRSTLDRRLRAILDATRNRRALTRSGAAMLIVLTAEFVLPTSMLQLAAQPAKPPAGSQPQAPATQPRDAARVVPIKVLSESGYPRMYVTFGTSAPRPGAGNDGTGVAGRYQLIVADPAQTHWRAVSGPTRKMALFTIPPGPIDKPLVVRLTLGVAQALGRVTDGKGHGVVGAAVQPRATVAGGDTYLFEPVKTDNAGYYELHDAPVGNGIVLQTALVPRTGESQAWAPAVATHEVQVSLEMPGLVDSHPARTSREGPWHSIGGFVVDENGRPLQDAVITAICIVVTPSGMPTAHDRAASTDSNGHWSALIPHGTDRIALRVSLPGFIAITDAPGGTVPAEDLNKATAVIVLHKGLTLVGRVRNTQGKLVPDALVTTQDSITTLVFGGPVQDATMGRTDANGTFRVGGMPPGPRELAVYAPGYPTIRARTNIVPDMKPAEITVEAGGSLTGVVVDAAGRPAAGAHVGARGANSVTDVSGHFQLNGLPLHRTFGLSASVVGASGGIEDAKVGAEPYRIVLLPKPVIRGRVLDDVTGQPITRFQSSLGVRSNPGEDVAFFPSDREDSNSQDGTFERRSISYPMARVRVRADGHLPAQTPEVKAGETPALFVLRLKRADDVIGAIFDPDGTPAEGASVAWVSSDRHAFVGPDGKLEGHYMASPEIVVKADARGRFTLPPSAETGTIFAIDQKGYAEQSSRDFKLGSKIPLKAWAQVKGTIDAGEGPTSVRFVQIVLLDQKLRSRSAPVNWMLSRPARADGSFNFDHVPSIPLAVGLFAENGLSHRVVLTPKPGQTQTVRIGGSGRRVEGVLKLPGDLGFDRVYSTYGPNRPLAVLDLRPAADPSDPVALLPEDKDPSHVLYEGVVEDGNRFKVNDVPPGDYVLHVTIRAAPQSEACGIPVALAHATVPVSVAAGTSGSPVAVGSISVKTIEYARAGDAAPQIQGQTTEGKPFSLDQLHGNLVLLDFWATWCANCQAETGHLKDISERYGNRAKLAIVGVNLDYRPQEAQQYVQQQHLTWLNVLTEGGWGDANPTLRRFGVTAIPSFWLVSPEGRVLARDIPAAALDQMIDNAMKR